MTLKPLLFVIATSSTTETSRTTLIHASTALGDSATTLDSVKTTAQGTASP